MTLLELQAMDPTVASGGNGNGKRKGNGHSNLSVTLCKGSASSLSVLLCSS